jgi:hypothetical protein
MTVRHPARWYLLVFGLVFLTTSSVRLYSYLTERRDIWWTPPTLLVPLTESADRVQILVRGTALQDLLGAGRLRLAAPGPATLAAADVGLRFNNWDRVRAERAPTALIAAATAGSAATLLLLGLILWGRERPEA